MSLNYIVIVVCFVNNMLFTFFVLIIVNRAMSIIILLVFLFIIICISKTLAVVYLGTSTTIESFRNIYASLHTNNNH